MESSPGPEAPLGGSSSAGTTADCGEFGLVASNLVEGILGSINPGRRTEPLTSSQGQSRVVTTCDDLPGASYAQIHELIPAFVVVAIDATDWESYCRCCHSIRRDSAPPLSLSVL